MFDKDGGGSISTDEIKQVLSFGQNLDEAVIQQIINQVDANGDGEISYEEFAAMMLKNIQDEWRWINMNEIRMILWAVRPILTKNYNIQFII